MKYAVQSQESQLSMDLVLSVAKGWGFGRAMGSLQRRGVGTRITTYCPRPVLKKSLDDYIHKSSWFGCKSLIHSASFWCMKSITRAAFAPYMRNKRKEHFPLID